MRRATNRRGAAGTRTRGAARAAVVVRVLVVGALAGAGCQDRGTVLRDDAPSVSIDDFSNAGARAGERTTGAGRPRPPVLGPMSVGGDVADAIARPGDPRPAPVGEDAPTAREVVVDAVVGSINGRPIRADAFLLPKEARLTALALEKGMTRARWRQVAKGEIEAQLFAIVQDELLRAEAMAMLKPEDRDNLAAYMRLQQRSLLAQYQGSVEQANETISSREGKTFFDKLRETEKKALIQMVLREKINPHVQVTSADVREYYESHAEEFNPPPVYTFRRITIAASKADAAAEVRRRLASGEAFEKVAGIEANVSRNDDNGAWRQSWDGDQSEGEFFSAGPLNDAARAMAPGEVRGPIEVGRWLEWLAFEGVEARSRTLYEAQHDIEATLLNLRFAEQRDRYFGRIFDRPKMVELSVAAERLLNLAEERYFDGTARARAARATP